MRAIISAGGTGGHLYPALALADELASLSVAKEILFITGTGEFEHDLVCNAGYAIKTSDIHGFRRKVSFDFAKTAIQTGRGYRQIKKLLKEFSPHVLVGFGGAVSFPAVLAASHCGIPTVIHEQNVVPGLTNKLLSRIAGTIAVSFKESIEHFTSGARVEVTGNPIRSSLFNATKENAYKQLKLNRKHKTLVIFGGSQGAHAINEAIGLIYPELIKHNKFNLFHVTGEKDHPRVVERIRSYKDKKEALGSEVYNAVPYLDEMGLVYKVADLVLCRAGAGTVAELTAFGIPAIVVPYPYATGRHQEKNAAVMKERGAARVIDNSDLENKLKDTIETLLFDDHALKEMKAAAIDMGIPDAAHRLAKLVRVSAKWTGRIDTTD